MSPFTTKLEGARSQFPTNVRNSCCHVSHHWKDRVAHTCRYLHSAHIVPIGNLTWECRETENLKNTVLQLVHFYSESDLVNYVLCGWFLPFKQKINCNGHPNTSHRAMQNHYRLQHDLKVSLLSDGFSENGISKGDCWPVSRMHFSAYSQCSWFSAMT